MRQNMPLEDAVDTKLIDKVIQKRKGKPGELLGILEEVQELHQHKFLPRKTLEYIAQKTGIDESKIYSVATFYAFFNLKPQGDHSIVICRGTACHTRGSRSLLEDLGKLLGFSQEELAEGGEKVFLTTSDNKFTLKTVACFGQCALAPVVEIDGVIHSNMTPQKLKTALARVSKKRVGK